MAYTDPNIPRTPAQRKAPLRLGLILGMSVLPLIITLPQALDPFGFASDGVVQGLLALLVTAVWVALVGGRGREERPVATLVVTGMLSGSYTFVIALVAAVNSAGAAALIALPFLLLAMLAAGALWGLLAGGLAVVVQRLRGVQG